MCFIKKIFVFLFIVSFAHLRGCETDRIIVTHPLLMELVEELGASIFTPLLIQSSTGCCHAKGHNPSDIKHFQKARLIITLGALTEGDLFALLSKIQPHSVFSCESTIKLIHKRFLKKCSTQDPHFWLVPTLMKEAIDRLYQKFEELFPNHTTKLRLNKQKSDKRFYDLIQSIQLKMTPLKGVRYRAYHDMFAYVDATYGIVCVDVLSPSIDLSHEALERVSLTPTIPLILNDMPHSLQRHMISRFKNAILFDIDFTKGYNHTITSFYKNLSQSLIGSQ